MVAETVQGVPLQAAEIPIMSNPINYTLLAVAWA